MFDAKAFHKATTHELLASLDGLVEEDVSVLAGKLISSSLVFDGSWPQLHYDFRGLQTLLSAVFGLLREHDERLISLVATADTTNERIEKNEKHFRSFASAYSEFKQSTEEITSQLEEELEKTTKELAQKQEELSEFQNSTMNDTIAELKNQLENGSSSEDLKFVSQKLEDLEERFKELEEKIASGVAVPSVSVEDMAALEEEHLKQLAESEAAAEAEREKEKASAVLNTTSGHQSDHFQQNRERHRLEREQLCKGEEEERAAAAAQGFEALVDWEVKRLQKRVDEKTDLLDFEFIKNSVFQLHKFVGDIQAANAMASDERSEIKKFMASAKFTMTHLGQKSVEAQKRLQRLEGGGVVSDVPIEETSAVSSATADAIKASQTRNEDQIRVCETKISNLVTETASVSAKVEEALSSLVEVTRNITQSSSSIGDLAERVSGLEPRVTALDASIEDSMATMGTQMQELKDWTMSTLDKSAMDMIVRNDRNIIKLVKEHAEELLPQLAANFKMEQSGPSEPERSQMRWPTKLEGFGRLSDTLPKEKGKSEAPPIAIIQDMIERLELVESQVQQMDTAISKTGKQVVTKAEKKDVTSLKQALEFLLSNSMEGKGGGGGGRSLAPVLPPTASSASFDPRSGSKAVFGDDLGPPPGKKQALPAMTPSTLRTRSPGHTGPF